MRKLIAITAVPLLLALTLAGCSADADEPTTTSSSSTTESPAADPATWTFEEAVKTAPTNDSPVTFGDWKIEADDLKLDATNSLPTLFSVSAPTTEGFVYAGVQMKFTYTGEGDAAEAIGTLMLVLADETGAQFGTQAPQELYDALSANMDIDNLESDGVAVGSTFVEVDPATEAFYIAVGDETTVPTLIKLGVTEF